MNFDRCKNCQTWHWENESCPPLFFVIHEDYNGTEPIEIRGSDFESAAIQYACDFDNGGDHTLLERGSENIVVKDLKGNSKSFSIHAETTIDYSAREIK